MNRDRGLLNRIGGVFSDNPTSEHDLELAAGAKIAAAADATDLRERARGQHHCDAHLDVPDRRVRTGRGALPAVHHRALHDHTTSPYSHASMIRVGIIGASGYTGAELLRLCAQHPSFEVVYATGDTQAGIRAAVAVPQPGGALPDLVFEDVRSRPRRGPRPRVPRPSARGEHGARPAAGRHGRLRGRPLGGLPAEGRVAVPRVVRLHPRPARAAGRGRVRAARAASRRVAGRGAGRHARLPRHGGHPGAGAAGACRADRRPRASWSTASPASAAPAGR